MVLKTNRRPVKGDHVHCKFGDRSKMYAHSDPRWRIMCSVRGENSINEYRHACPHRGQGARFLLRAHKHFCTKIVKSLERAGGAAAPPAPQRRPP